MGHCALLLLPEHLVTFAFICVNKLSSSLFNRFLGVLIIPKLSQQIMKDDEVIIVVVIFCVTCIFPGN